LHVDVCHVHRVRDVGNVLHRRYDPVAQDRLADEPDVAKVVILRPDIERHIHVSADRLSFINDTRPARRQRRPTDVIATSPPRDPRRSPIEVFSRKPDPAIVREIGPAPVVIRSPAEILVTDPCPSVIGVCPVTVRVWAPVRIAHREVGLPAVSVAFDIDPVTAGKIVVNKIYRYIGSTRLRKSTDGKRQHAKGEENFFHNRM
jgi:hypothetical protein